MQLARAPHIESTTAGKFLGAELSSQQRRCNFLTLICSAAVLHLRNACQQSATTLRIGSTVIETNRVG
jgi:hypothetical protein